MDFESVQWLALSRFRSELATIVDFLYFDSNVVNLNLICIITFPQYCVYFVLQNLLLLRSSLTLLVWFRFQVNSRGQMLTR